MSSRDEEAWTIDELGRAVEAALSVGYEGQDNGQVRDVPDRRTIRYYTTLGLIDRPSGMRGRTALYGRRHLLQLVAIKRLQARGLSLSEVQAELSGLGLAGLRRLAALPAELSPAALASPADDEETGRRAGAFWGSLPADETVTPREDEDPRGDHDAPAPEREAARAEVRRGLGKIELGDELLLVFPACREVDADDARALRRAAEPLRALLVKLGLVEPV